MAPFCVHSEHDSDALLVCLSIYGPLTRVAGGVSISARRIKRFGPLATEWAFFIFGRETLPERVRKKEKKTNGKTTGLLQARAPSRARTRGRPLQLQEAAA